MNNELFDVVYIDTFDDLLAAEIFRHQIRQRFGLSEQQLHRLSSGHPTQIKRAVGYETALQYRNAIEAIGGVCWIQSINPLGQLIERRGSSRRKLFDRRTAYRASSSFPDRRRTTGRRSSDRRYR